jgi:hypothetical protein
MPVIIIGIAFVGIIVGMSLKDSRHNSTTQIQGNPVNLTNHLTEFTRLIRQGHRPSQWLINAAASEAYAKGDWYLAQTITNSYNQPQYDHRVSYDYGEVEYKPSPKKRKIEKVIDIQEEVKPQEEVIEEKKPLELSFNRITSPVDYISDDDWRMFVEISKIENPEFNTDNSMGMFRQNKKRLLKLGIDPDTLKTPVDQYNAFEAECVKLMTEGKNLINQSVAMPIQVDNESTPITLSGLLTVLRHAGTENATKWLDSDEERKKFPHTTKAFKRSNGCF